MSGNDAEYRKGMGEYGNVVRLRNESRIPRVMKKVVLGLLMSAVAYDFKE